MLIGVQLAQALQAVHDAGLVHRDVKPSNVLVRDIGGHDHAYLTDFGIAKAPAEQDGLTRTGALMGTPAYLSPEQIRGQQPGPRSDLYALGCVMFGASPPSARSAAMTTWRHAGPRRPAHHRQRQPYAQLSGPATTRSSRKRSPRTPKTGFRPAPHSPKPSKPPTPGGQPA